jgi:hypothetical protein
MSQSSSAALIRSRALLAVSLFAVVVVFLFVEPYPQPQSYHAFADDRVLLGIPNFWNVATNAIFLIPGIAGLWILGSGDHEGILPGLSPAYHILFIGVLLTAFGSAWFHLAPDNDTLFWDRLPMTIAFMSLTAIIVGEHISESLGRMLLWPLLVIGAASVLYWDFSESREAGDLRLYGLVQFLPLLLIPAILLMYELLDAALFNLGGFISGHSIKHVCAALGPMVLIYGGMNRRPRAAGES